MFIRGSARNGFSKVAFLLLKKFEKNLKKKLATIHALHLDEMLADKQACLSVQKN
jgi:hypothetical protein